MSKTIFLISLFVFAGIVGATRLDTVNALWQSWKLRHSKQYGLGEEAARFAIFTENVLKITKHNAENNDVKFAINKFADLTATEFKNIYASGYLGGVNTEAQKNAVKYNLADPLPDQIDWRSKGAVTPVKDQGMCGSCWAFSGTGVIEGFYFINSGQLLSFSEQQIVDCSTKDWGCDGGWHYSAVEYAGKYGLEKESDYPYTARDGQCRYDSSKAITTNKGFAYVIANSTDNLKSALVNDGPVSVAIEASGSVFQFYSKGVISAGCGADLDHAVLTVGYTKVGILEAFIVKNSWGKSWGDNGYVMISTIQQLNRGQGACGILAMPVIVT